MKCLLNTILMLLAVAVLTMLSAPQHAYAGNTIRVGPGGDHASLSEALAVARPGATIEILPGVQTGQWSIRVAVRLLGQPGAVLDGAGNGTLLTIAAPDVTVMGLTIRNGGRSLLDDDAAIRVEASGARIANNHLLDIHHAIYVMGGAARTVISGNRIHGRDTLIQEDRGNGIHLWNAPDTLVENNIVDSVRDGIYVGFAPRSSFRGNSFSRLRYGIHFMYADDNTFEDNTFDQSEAGAALLLGGCTITAGAPVVQGEIAPALAVTTLAGAPSEVRPEPGQALWLNFWASWCQPCRAEWPDLNIAQHDLGGAGLRLVAISVNEPADKVRVFLDAHPASFAVALDPQGQTARRYNVVGFPTHVLIDKTGIVRAIVRGPLDAARASKLLALVHDGPTTFEGYGTT